MASAGFPPIRRNDVFVGQPADRTVSNPPEVQTLIRAALLRKGLADARQRAALARRLGLADNEVLAARHVARAGELTPGELSALLQLSSGGTTGLIHRMQLAGHMTREAHPRYGRSAVVRLAPDLYARATDAAAPFAEEIDSLIEELPAARRTRCCSFWSASSRPPNATRIAWPPTLTPLHATHSQYRCQVSGPNRNIVELSLPRGRDRALASGRTRARVGSPE
jgi:DNA-binding MarR family transcriptional regulator